MEAAQGRPWYTARAIRGIAAALVVVCTASGCGSSQSTLSPDSHASDTIATLWWVMFVGSAVIFAGVLALLAVGVLRRRGADAPERRSPGQRFVAVLGLIVPAVILVLLFVLSIDSIPATSPSSSSKGLTVDVVARQFFWDVSYPGQGIRTANEIHIPVGVPVNVRVTSGDVIHSLWVPALNRKVDVIPGRTNVVTFNASRAGRFRGQCAEFCGPEHAEMALYVVAQPRAAFDAWLADQSHPNTIPTSAELERGQQIFLGSDCEYCHRIAGTNASGTIGPDLTHIGSRLTLAAGTIPNTPGSLAGWIIDPQHIKPGNKMPGTSLDGRDLQALVDYLESLR
jgi:cytochrome c oxidase subunit II